MCKKERRRTFPLSINRRIPGECPGERRVASMRKDIAGPGTESTMPKWESLGGLVREKAQELIQQILEEGVTEFLGVRKISDRISEVGRIQRGPASRPKSG